MATKFEAGKAQLESKFKTVEKEVENISAQRCLEYFGDVFVAAVTDFDLDDFDEAGRDQYNPL